MLFVDVDYTYEGVERDLEVYSLLVNDRGIVLLHNIVLIPDDPKETRRLRSEVNDIEVRHLL